MGVPIYWLNGAKVADDYADFYDEDWDEERHNQNKNELGANGPDTGSSGNYPRTGCDHDGTEAFTPGGSSVPLGSTADTTRVGRPNSSTSSEGPSVAAPSRTPTKTAPCTGSRRSSRWPRW